MKQLINVKVFLGLLPYLIILSSCEMAESHWWGKGTIRISLAEILAIIVILAIAFWFCIYISIKIIYGQKISREIKEFKREKDKQS